MLLLWRVVHVLLCEDFLYGGHGVLVLLGRNLQVWRPLFNQLPVSSVSFGVGVVPGSRYLVVNHLGDLVGFRFPGASRRGGLSVSPVCLVPHLDFFLAGPVLLIEGFLGLDFGGLVPFSRDFVVFGEGFGEDPWQFRGDLTIEHEFVGGVPSDSMRRVSVGLHVLVDLLLGVVAFGVCGVDDQF